MKTLAEVDALADRAHAGQVDKTGVPYVEHVRAVAAGLAPLGTHLAMAGLLHDVVEDTDWTAERLRADGIPDRVVALVEAVTNRADLTYEEKIRRITADPEATLVKIADNAHNSRADRSAALPPDQRERLAAKYRAARAVLWPAADPDRIATILRVVNPDLLAELDGPRDPSGGPGTDGPRHTP
ncbi:HD domain-containing protein [Streptomyces cinereoruber]|uniref:HD domain-containing protein n=1 Tax=Streptomyces cinereoruber TaxID=67260 RepID=UPI0033985E4A